MYFVSRPLWLRPSSLRILLTSLLLYFVALALRKFACMYVVCRSAVPTVKDTCHCCTVRVYYICVKSHYSSPRCPLPSFTFTLSSKLSHFCYCVSLNLVCAIHDIEIQLRLYQHVYYARDSHVICYTITAR